MQYMGGKFCLSKIIVPAINELLTPGQIYYEPFCGACHIAKRITAKIRICADIHPDLIMMWKALQDGWVPPDAVSEAEYTALRHAPSSPLRAFIGFGCSFGAKWFGGYARGGPHGYARGGPRNYARAAKNSLVRDIKSLQNVIFECMPYYDLDIEPGSFVYCDPPYNNTTHYKDTEKFDSDRLWLWAIEQVKNKNCTVLISEYSAPEGIQLIWEREQPAALRKKDGSRQLEKLYLLNRQTLGA